MKERGIIFNAEMVRAILSGSKTQTRRIMKPQPKPSETRPGDHWLSSKKLETMVYISDFTPGHCAIADSHLFYLEHCFPFGKPGDRLWVRETWARYNVDQHSHDMAYRATPPDDWPEEGRWRPSIHMPSWASRITLEIVSVRVERLQEISEEDARAEGITDGGCLACGCSEPCECEHPQPSAKESFAALWQSIYGDKGWGDNPWVWVIDFKRVDEND